MPESQDVVALAQRLMAIDSTSGREGALMTHVHTLLEQRGWTVTRIPVSEGRFAVFARAGDVPFVTLSTHLDTVPPYIAPRLDGDVLWGRGACDAKGIASAMICAGDVLRAEGAPIALLFVVGEEITHDGAHASNAWIARSGLRSRAIVDGEPTESLLGRGTKGAMRVIVRTKGEPAHSAYPHLGHSAIEDLVGLLAELPHLDLPRSDLFGPTTVNIGQISGGVADNVVAPWAEARLMARTVSPAEDAMRVLERWAAGRAELEQGITVPPVQLGVLPGFETSVVAFATDIPELGNWGTPYLFGPGSIHVAHRDDEHVRVDELRAAVDAYARLARALG
ncbi:MAG TPA: M20/M25/M40 family metallo-hydrolase [Gemmatimonadaceae bacterium]|nr:M20/M25/M40 family metallo-hydrolase [Gemmatimonadaceae bacterium]